MWPVDGMFVLPGVFTSLCLDTVSARMGVGHFLQLAAAGATPCVTGPPACNSLSDDLCDPTLSIDIFKRLLETRLFLPRDATQSAVLLWQVVCLSVCP